MHAELHTGFPTDLYRFLFSDVATHCYFEET